MPRKKTIPQLTILGEELENKPEEIIPKKRSNRNEAKPMVYSKISSSFLLFVVFLVGVILYFSFSKIDIKVYPKKETVNVSFDLDVVPKKEELSGTIEGKVVDLVMEDAKQFNLAQGQQLLAAKATGKIKIINNYSRQQALVATTRFLSPDNKIFRLEKSVLVPAKQSLEVDVYADVAGAEYEIGPAKFTIPGLWEGLQDKIYGESFEPMKRAMSQVGVLAQADIQAAQDKLIQEISQKALIEIQKNIQIGNYHQVVATELLLSVVSDVPNSEVDNFTVQSKVRTVGVFIPKETLKQEIVKKINDSLTQNKVLSDIDQDKLSITVKNYDVEKGMAQITVSATGAVVVSENSPILDKSKLRGMSKQEVVDYFKNSDNIESADVIFSPFWVMSVPRSLDSVKIEIVK